MMVVFGNDGGDGTNGGGSSCHGCGGGDYGYCSEINGEDNGSVGGSDGGDGEDGWWWWLKYEFLVLENTKSKNFLLSFFQK